MLNTKRQVDNFFMVSTSLGNNLLELLIIVQELMLCLLFGMIFIVLLKIY